MCLEFIGYQNHKAKAAEIAKIKKMRSHELRRKLIELEKLKKEAEFIEKIKCKACLKDQFIQRKIEKKTYNEGLFANMIRENNVCQCCEHEILIYDGDDVICKSCGSVQSPSVPYKD